MLAAYALPCCYGHKKGDLLQGPPLLLTGSQQRQLIDLFIHINAKGSCKALSLSLWKERW